MPMMMMPASAAVPYDGLTPRRGTDTTSPIQKIEVEDHR